MTTTPAIPAAAPSADDMITAMFSAFSCLVPGAAKQSDPALRDRDTLASLTHYGADPADIATISAWLNRP